MMTYLLAAVLAGGLAISDNGAPAAAAPPAAAPGVTDATIAAAARDMRIQIYDTFREDRAEYDRRQAAWTQVNKAWHDAGCPSPDREKMIHWLADAQIQSRSGSTGPMPEAPKFTPVPGDKLGPDAMQWFQKLAEDVDSTEPAPAAAKLPAAPNDKATATGPTAPPAAPDQAHQTVPQVNVTAFMRDLVKPAGSELLNPIKPVSGEPKAPSGEPKVPPSEPK